MVDFQQCEGVCHAPAVQLVVVLHSNAAVLAVVQLLFNCSCLKMLFILYSLASVVTGGNSGSYGLSSAGVQSAVPQPVPVGAVTSRLFRVAPVELALWVLEGVAMPACLPSPAAAAY